MSDHPRKRPGNRHSLFWRMWLRSLVVKRPQAALGMGSLLVGAAVAAALLNLYGDARRKMSQEFRAYGANVILAPAAAPGASSAPPLMDQHIVAQLEEVGRHLKGLAHAPLLYVVARIRPIPADPRLPEFQHAVAVGTDFAALHALYPGWRVQEGKGSDVPGPDECFLGAHVANYLHLAVGGSVQLQAGDSAAAAPAALRVAGILSTGGAEDDRVFLDLGSLQRLAGLEGKISLVELSLAGERAEMERGVQELARNLPGVDVRPVHQIVESQGRVLGTIRWLAISLTALILVIIGLCVMATMAAIVLERRKDIAVMKALGASDELVMRLFLSEGASLGFAGGLAGFALGAVLARELARHLFDVSLGLSWWTLPLVVLMSVVLAGAATLFPIRVVRRIEPAVTLRM
ncbi:MAG: ABC transporter permease [Acidobacteriia bacterium]|nr:ABC transporter permease [Terriglobia bacterium]